jgi:NADH-quinone oxidoreductase, chain G
MPKLTIDGIEIEVEPGTSILQACEQLGIEIPRFCYHERLSVPANCRMCLVEMERAPKPVAACAMPCGDGMVVKTNTELVHKARKGVMEFLLINHPLDCPICDQGGECDLQDQAMAYGFDRGRYGENKRAVKDKYMGPLIRTEMTRCIHCTRCIRFVNEIAGVPDLGAVNRGEHMEITTFVEKAIGSELSGNLADVCPVGALLSKPYAFTARPWELRKTETIDVMDAVGSNVRVDTRGPEVMRVLPRVNEDVNEEWISDKTRFAYDGLKRQRLDRPYVRKDGKLQPATWTEAFQAIAAKVKGVPGNRIAAIAGDLVDVESMLALKELMAGLGSANIDCRQDGALFDTSARAGYLFNSGIAGIERADVILLVGTYPRWEGTLINARIRKRYLMGGLKVAVIGEAKDLTYPYTHLGNGADVLQQLSDGANAFADVLKGAKNPMIIVGAGAFRRKDGVAIQAAARALAESVNAVRDDWNGFNVLHTAAGRVGGIEIGFVPGNGGRDVAGILDGAGKGDLDVVYLLGADEVDTAKLGKAFVIYQGHHGDKGAHRADVILPGAAYTEKNAIYVNTEGRPQLARLATFPPGEAREDWKILRALSEQLGHKLPYDSLAQLRQRLADVNPIFAKIGSVTPATWAPFGTAGSLDAAPFVSPVTNYYMTDPISRASVTMARCTETFVKSAESAQERTGTHG